MYFCRALGRPSTVRPILKKGCEYTKDDIHSMFKFAIDYEKKFGSLEDLESMEKRYQEKLGKFAQEGEIVPEQSIQTNNLFKTTEKTNQRVANKKEKLKEMKNLKRKNKENPVPATDDVFYKTMKHDLQKPRIQVVSKNSNIVEEKTEKIVSLIGAKPTMEEEKIATQPQSERDTLDKEPPAYPNYLDTRLFPLINSFKYYRNTVFVKNFPLTFGEEDVKLIFPNVKNTL